MALEKNNKRKIYFNGKWSDHVVPLYNASASFSYTVGDRRIWNNEEYVCNTTYVSSPGPMTNYSSYWTKTDPTTLDLTMAGSSPIPFSTSKDSEVDIPTSDSTISTSRQSGRLRFNKVTIPYVFTHEISRYNPGTPEYSRRSLNEMNRLVKQHVSAVENWIYAPEEYGYNPSADKLIYIEPSRLYDTALCDDLPDTISNWFSYNHEGYYLTNPRCTNFSFTKQVSNDIWLIQYQIEITVDPWMYEYGANPKTYSMFSGPTTDGVGMDQLTLRMFSEPTSSGALVTPTTKMWRRIWTNDNRNWILSDSATKISGEYHVQWTFKPNVAAIYTGDIGVYMNFYVKYTYNDVEYWYHVNTITATSGSWRNISSSKIITANEFGYTNQNGVVFMTTIGESSGSPGSLDDLVTSTNGHIPLQFIWGTIKKFQTNGTTDPFMISARGPVSQFKRVIGPGTEPETILIGDTFYFDNDAYNQLNMETTQYGFYTLESPDNARRRV